jgi:hypothetical protein
MSGAMTEGSMRPRICDHTKVEELGADGFAEFYVCQRCRDVIVVQGTHQWVVTASSHQE